MGFKAQLDLDVVNTFINPDEFAESCILEGITFNCVVNSDDIEDRRKSTGQLGYDTGLFEFRVEIFFKTSDFPYRLVEGQQVVFSSNDIASQPFYVSKCIENMGVIQLGLTSTMS